MFTAFNEPSRPIPADVTSLTGITTEMVAGRRIDEAAVSAFAEDAVIVIAHNAGFNRKFAERYWPVFERKAWRCFRDRVAVAPEEEQARETEALPPRKIKAALA